MKKCFLLSTDGRSEFFDHGLMVTLASLRRTNPAIPIVIFQSGLSADQERALGDVEIVAIDPAPYDSCHREDLTATTFFKLEVHRLVDYDRVVYLDSDVVVLDDVGELFEVDGLIAGVTRELGVEHDFVDVDRIRAQEPGLGHGRIMNGGVLSFDRRRWADQKLLQEALDVIRDYGWTFFRNADQGVLNILAGRHGGATELPLRYNFCMFPDMGHPVPYPVKRNPSGLLAPYEVGRIQRRLMAMGVPLPFHWGRFVKILHWNGWDKPWRFDERQVPAIERKRSYAECYDQFL